MRIDYTENFYGFNNFFSDLTDKSVKFNLLISSSLLIHLIIPHLSIRCREEFL